MRFQPVKCNMMQMTRKHLNKIQASYTLEGAVLEKKNDCHADKNPYWHNLSVECLSLRFATNAKK